MLIPQLHSPRELLKQSLGHPEIQNGSTREHASRIRTNAGLLRHFGHKLCAWYILPVTVICMCLPAIHTRIQAHLIYRYLVVTRVCAQDKREEGPTECNTYVDAY